MKCDAFSRFHPLVNFIFFIGVIACSVVFQHPAYLAATLLASLAYALLLHGNKLWRLLLAALPLFLLIAAINPFFNTEGTHILFYIFDRPYTLDALCYGAVTAFILTATILWFTCYNAVMTSDKFTSLFGRSALSLLLVMILHMIPSLSKKIKQISTARRCIGMGVGEKNTLRQKIRNGISVLSAVTDHALEGSVITADSMRARGYGSCKRTSYRSYRFSARDCVLLLLEVFFPITVVLAGHMDVSYTPTLAIQNISWGFLIYCVYLAIPLILSAKEAIEWRILRSRI